LIFAQPINAALNSDNATLQQFQVIFSRFRCRPPLAMTILLAKAPARSTIAAMHPRIAQINIFKRNTVHLDI
jgi:hypothetical protein